MLQGCNLFIARYQTIREVLQNVDVNDGVILPARLTLQPANGHKFGHHC